jgi:diguanylate cyclase (GGDEF)-like protein/PAS domain S-box-containing protein
MGKTVNLGLRTKVVLIATSVVLVAIATIMFSMGYFFKTEYTRALESRALAIAQSLKVQLERVLQFGIDIDNLIGFEEQAADVVKTYDGIGSAFVVNPDGLVLFHSDPAVQVKSFAGVAVQQALSAGKEIVAKSVDLEGGESYVAIVPVNNRGGERIASVVVGFSGEIVAQQVSKVITVAFVAAVIVMTLGVILLLAALSRFVTRPLASLVNSIEGLRHSSDFSVRVGGGGKDEIGVLIEGFNSLLGHIEARNAQLEHARDSLEEEVDRRTERLRETNQKLTLEIASRETAEANLHLYYRTFESTDEAIVVCDKNGIVINVNPAYLKLSGRSREEVVGQEMAVLAHLPGDRSVVAGEWQEILKSGRWSGEIQDRRKSGEVLDLILTINAVRDRQGDIVNLVGAFTDITELKNTERRLQQLAYFDSLTGLPNRSLFLDRLQKEIEVSAREGSHFGVLFIDLDRFKYVNDTLGHSAGDLLLEEAAKRIRWQLRPEDGIARLGGDEFIVMVRDVKGEDHLARAATRILSAFIRPFEIHGRSLEISASIGISVFPTDGMDAETLIKNADSAMYQAKDSGRGRYYFFDASIGQKVNAILTLSSELRRALERNEFLLHYQPIVDLKSGQVAYFEALVRWRRADGKMVSPADFIPFAEETGFITLLGERVIDLACQQARELIQSGTPIPISVNVSAKQLQDDALPELISRALRRYEIDPALIEIEITESALILDPPRVKAHLTAIANLGVAIAIDDFGAGHSSLHYLVEYPVHKIKIDRSLIDPAINDARNGSIVTSIVDLGRRLGIKTVGEGVETKGHHEFLEKIGGDLAQGYYYAKPMPADIAFSAKVNGTKLDRVANSA